MEHTGRAVNLELVTDVLDTRRTCTSRIADSHVELFAVDGVVQKAPITTRVGVIEGLTLKTKLFGEF